MIARIWRGVVRTGDADEYATYIRDTGFAEYGRTAGNRGAWMLRRDEGEGETEFVTLSMWDSRDAIEASPARTSRRPCSTPRTRST
jgi:heme-degrading monooxygenase HmoA